MSTFMNDLFLSSAAIGVALSLLAYQAGVYIKKKTGSALANPLLIAIILTILVLVICKVDYVSYQASAKYLSYLLTPATVSLAVPLYKKIQILKDNLFIILAAIFSGVITSLVSVLALSVIFGLSHELYVTMLPKSITTAIGMGVSEELGGLVTITVVSIIITGVFGNITGDLFVKIWRLKSPIAKGLALGCSSHAIGTAKAMEMGEIEGAMSSLAIVVTGLFTVIGASIFAMLY